MTSCRSSKPMPETLLVGRLSRSRRIEALIHFWGSKPERRRLQYTQGGCPSPMMSLTQLSNCLTLGGSFSSVSTATIARKGAFCSIFWALQDLHSFAPLRPEKFSKFSSQILHFFRNFSRQNIKFWQFSLQISLKLNQILSEFHRLHRKRCKMPKIKRKPQKIRKKMKKVRFELDKS